MDSKTHAAWQWNPPARAKQKHAPFDGVRNVESATECTGLAANVPGDEEAARALSELYDIHELKVGKAKGAWSAMHKN